MIHVCSLSRVYSTIDETGARHLVTLLRLTDRVDRPRHIAPENHLVLAVDDISTPMVVHCFAGISRSTAGAFVVACAINPDRDEREIAQAIRNASSTAQPNARIVEIADRLLKRDGRMVRAVETLGPAEFASEGIPFRLDLA